MVKDGMTAPGNISERTKMDLQERVKELSCLYGIARLAARTDMEMDELLLGIVEVLPAAWLYPEAARARIFLDGQSYPPCHYRNIKHRQRSPFIINGKPRGYAEVVYLEEKPERDEGPFLNEERHLLDTVSREVSVIIMRREAEQNRSVLEEQLRHADRLATIGQLAAGVAHELNEPLGHILGFAQLAQKHPDLPAQVQTDIEKILSTSLYAREIVRKLLIFSRQIPPKKTKVDLNLLVEEGLGFFESRCANEGIEITCSLAPDLPEIEADHAQLNQVFVNLVANAVQAMPDGGKIMISTQRKRTKVSLVIEDTGAGMDRETLKKIFTPFFTTKDVGLGTGLGLPVAHGIVTAHEGSIKVENRLDNGVRCEVQLPIHNRSFSSTE